VSPDQGEPFFKNAKDAAVQALIDDFPSHGYNIGDGTKEVHKVDRYTGTHLKAGVSQAKIEISPGSHYGAV